MVGKCLWSGYGYNEVITSNELMELGGALKRGLYSAFLDRLACESWQISSVLYGKEMSRRAVFAGGSFVHSIYWQARLQCPRAKLQYP